MATPPMIVIADGALSIDEAVLKLDDYPLKTLCRYDLPGPGDPYLLTREELIRTRALRSRIRNAELDWFLDRASSAPWPSPEADLRQADPGVAGGLYDQLTALYEQDRSDDHLDGVIGDLAAVSRATGTTVGAVGAS